MNTWSDHLIAYYRGLRPVKNLPPGVDWLYPQKSAAVMDVVERFCRKYFDDAGERHLFLGINPGRFGAGITGVNFTAARQLSLDCGIPHPFPNGSELSAEFIYELIAAYGGPALFYRNYFIASVCPLGFVEAGKNLNYYDDPLLYAAVKPFIVKNMNRLLQGNVNRGRCICIGGEKNFRYLNALNEEQGWFGEIVPVPHPRFIMQYRRRQKQQFIDQYLQAMPV